MYYVNVKLVIHNVNNAVEHKLVFNMNNMNINPEGEIEKKTVHE